MAIHYMESAALREDLDRGQKLALMCYANSANDENRVGFPGFDALTRWTGLGRSQLYNVISQLVEAGLLVKVRDGGRGRRAEYAVFPKGDCCPLHGPLPGYSAGSDVEITDAGSDPSDPAPDLHVSDVPEVGSGTPDPQAALQGPTMGPTMGPIATGPLTGYPASSSGHLGEVGDSSAREDFASPSPSTPDGIHRTCPDHRLTPALGPCGGCGHWRRAAEVREAETASAVLAERRLLDAEERERARTARDLADGERAACRLCDDEGTAAVADGSSVRCLHDAAANERAHRIRQEAKAALAAPRGKAVEAGRRKALEQRRTA